MTFTKEILSNYRSPDFGNFEQCNCYRLFENDNLIGQFVVGEKVAFLMTTYNRFRIDIISHWLKDKKYDIIDTKTESKIGYYTLPNWRLGNNDIGTLTLNNEKYLCKRQKADIRKNIFKKSTWGHYKLWLSNQSVNVFYRLKVETEWINASNAEFRNARGETDAFQADPSLVLLGLFFIERMLNLIDSD
jgi:hypothetical protein